MVSPKKPPPLLKQVDRNTQEVMSYERELGQ